MGIWTVPTGRGHETTVVRPARCPNGHSLRPPNLNSGSDVGEAWFECLTCGLTIHRLHRAREQWVTANATSKDPIDIPGFDAHPGTPP